MATSRRIERQSLQDRILKLMLEENLQPGAAMPTEVQLMDELGVSRNSVREALSGLRAVGVVEIRHGHGTVVGTSPMDAMRASLLFRSMSRVGYIRDLVDVREALEVTFIAETIARATDAEIAQIQAVSQRMVDQGYQPAIDREFHQALYAPTGNAMVLELIRLSWDIYSDVNELLEPTTRTVDDLVEAHVRIVDAVQERDVQAAQAAVRDHFADVKARIDRASLRAEPAQTA